ncbi:MAG: hypothetical protein U0452_09870 [Anaerolineae bacterium]
MPNWMCPNSHAVGDDGQAVRCDGQQKLADYVRKGNRLVLVGRLRETFGHEPVHNPARGARRTGGVQRAAFTSPFEFGSSITPTSPVSFLETYEGAF